MAIVVLAVAVAVEPYLRRGPPGTPFEWVGALALLGTGLSLLLWRRSPTWTLVLGWGLLLVAAASSKADATLALLVCTALTALAGYAFSGRAAWTSGAAFAAWLAGLYLITGEHDIGTLMFTVPGFVAGTALRLRRQTADELALRGRELEEERELFAQLAVRNERARIAAELHDIIGHSLSVMVVQAAAGQRLVQTDARAGDEVLGVIADSARQGRADLRRLVDLLGGQDVAAPDLSLIDELVTRAAGTGLRVTCRFEGDRDGVPSEVAGLAFSVVREALTNAIRHSPGSSVSVLVRGEGRGLLVRVENGAPTSPTPAIEGTGQGLRALGARIEEAGGRLTYGASTYGGWVVEAHLAAGGRSTL